MLEAGDAGDNLDPVAGHGVGVALGLLVLPAGKRRLRYQRPQASVVGHVHQARQLLVHQRQLFTQRFEPRRGGGELAFEQRSGHGP